MFSIDNFLKPVRRKRLIVIAATAAAVVLFALVSLHNYMRARDQAVADRIDSANRALVAVDDHISRLIEDSDSYLRTLRTFYISRGGANENAASAVREFIQRTIAADRRNPVDVAIVDATGHVVFMLSRPTPPNEDLSDLAYFQALKSDPTDRLIVDPTRLGRASREFRFRLVRPILVDGRLAGAVVMALYPEAIVDLFNKLSLGPNSAISVSQLDEHRFIARVPVGNRDYFGRPFGEESVWAMINRSPSGVFHRPGQVDGLMRYFAFLKSDGLPIVSIIGVADVDIDAALAGTRRDIEFQIIAAALVASAICGLVLRIVSVEDRLRRSRLNLEHGQRIGRIGSVEVDLVSKTVAWSDELYTIYGRDRALGPADLESFLAYIHPEDRRHAEEMRRRQEEGIDGGPMEYRIIRPDGQIRWIHREVELVRDSAGKALSMVATEQDITERRRMEEELQREHSLLVFAQRMAGMGSAEVDLRTGFAVRSDEFFRLVGADSRNPPDGNDQVAGVFHHDDQERVAEAVRTMLAGRPVPTMELRIVRPDGEIRWLRRDQDIILGNDGKPERAVVTLMDITDQKLVELQKDEFAAALISLANHDALTGLPAARLAGDRLLMACHQAGRERTHVALLFIDLDGFKAANDRHGHAAGDLVLKEVASRLRDAIRSGDTAARHGGDEFLVILNGVGTEAAKQVAAKLCDVIGEPIYYGAAEIRIGASIGIAIFPDHARTPEDLLRLADQAMYAVKRSGKNGFTVYAEA